MQNLLAKIKAHPYITGVVVFVVGLLILYWYNSGSSAAQQPQGVTGLSPAELAAEVQLAQVNAGATAAAAQSQAQLQALAEQGATAVQIAQLQATVAEAGQQTQQNIAVEQGNVETHALDTQLSAIMKQYDTQSLEAALTTEAAIQEAQIASATTLGTVQAAAQQNEFIAQQNAQVQTAIATTQGQVAIAGYQANVQVAQAIASAQKTSAVASGAFGFLGTLAKAIF